MIVARKAKLFWTAIMRIKLIFFKEEVALLIFTPLGLQKSDSSIGRINELLSRRNEWTEYWDSDIHTLLSRKCVIIIEMIFFDRLKNVNFFFAFKNTGLVTCIYEQNYCEHDTAQCSHFRRQRTSTTFSKSKSEWLTEFVLVK